MVLITKIQVYLKCDGKNTLGYAHITLGESYVVKNLRIVNGAKGVFVGMPTNKTAKGDYIDIFFPVNTEARIYLTKTVIEAFTKEFPGVMKGLFTYHISDDDNEI
ncbi:MAG: SpoVG family protein [Spirochaetia bacterium]|nr:SpoVG family protein [Spirochaetia bacterium]